MDVIRLGSLFKKDDLDADQRREFELELAGKTILNMRFVSWIVLIVVLLFGIVDYINIGDKEILNKLLIFRLGFVLIFLIPFTAYFSWNKKPVPQFLIFINALGYSVFLFMLSHIARVDVQAIFHDTFGLFLLNIGVFILFGLKRRYALIISLLLFILVDLNFAKLAAVKVLEINKNDVRLWFLIVSAISFLISMHIEGIHKKVFIISYKLKQANQSRYKLFSIVSHDLKNIISAQASISDYLQYTVGKISEEERSKFLILLDKSSQNALTMFEDLMMWIKSQMDIIKPIISEIHLDNFVKKQMEQFQLLLDNKNIRVEMENIDLLGIETDATILSLVFRNILGNAIKYSHKGSTIKVEANNHSQGFQLVVTDSGIGIPKNKLNTLFDLNKLLSTYGTDGEKGTGMGLVLSQDLLSHIRGNIYVQSTPGQGTKVFINIPFHDSILRKAV